MKILYTIFFSFSVIFSYSNEDRDFELINDYFGKQNIEKITKIYGTNSLNKNRIYKIETKDNKKYSGKFLGVNETKSYIEFDAFKTASAINISPNIKKIDYENNFVIYDYIDSVPFIDTKNEKFKKNFIKSLAKNIRKMHGSQRFSTKDSIFDLIINEKLPKVKPLISKTEYSMIQDITMIMKIYFNSTQDLVSSHRDLVNNTLMDKSSKVYLIDFKSASVENKYYDISTALLFFCQDKKDEKDLKKIYFGEKTSQEQEDKIYLMKQIVLISSALDNLKNISKDYKNFNPSKRKSFEEIMQERLKTGNFTLNTNQDIFLYSRALLDEFIKNTTSEKYMNLIKEISNKYNQKV